VSPRNPKPTVPTGHGLVVGVGLGFGTGDEGEGSEVFNFESKDTVLLKAKADVESLLGSAPRVD